MTPPTQNVFRPGDVLAGRYRIDAALGSGGFGAVFRATQLAIGRAVALKVLHPELLQQADGPVRFQREALMAQKLEHPNTVRLYDFGQTEQGVPYIVFELLKGESLEAALKARGAMSPGRVARVGAQVLKSLMEAHALGIVHRDIKPANLMLCEFQGESDFVKVLDFGIAKATDATAAAGLTKAGLVIGTPQYMPPEHLLGNAASPSGDLYALGLTMAEALTGRMIFQGDNASDVVMMQLSPAPVPLPPLVLQGPLGPVLLRATQKDVTRRYATAAEMLGEIEATVRQSGGDLDRAPSAPQQTPFAQAPTRMSPVGAPISAPTAHVPYGAQPGPYLPVGATPAVAAPAPRASGMGAGVIIGALAAVIVLGGVGIGAVMLVSSSSKRHTHDDSSDEPAKKTKDTEVASKKPSQSDDDDDGAPVDAKRMRRRIEGAGWKVIGDSTSHSDSLDVITFTIQQGTEYGGLYLYEFKDAKIAAMTESSLSSGGTMVTRRDGPTLVAAYVGNDKAKAKALLADVFP